MKSFSFFEKISQSAKPIESPKRKAHKTEIVSEANEHEEPLLGELAVDVIETQKEYIVRAMIAGVHTNDIDIATTRNSLTITGTRTDEKNGTEGSYVCKELYWGAFERVVDFDEEIDPEEVSAFQSQGLLTIILPKFDKNRIQKVRVRSNDKN